MASKTSLASLSRRHITVTHFSKRLDALSTLSDQETAIVCGALVERTLEESIAKRLIRMKKKDYEEVFAERGVLGNFYSKIRLGLTMNLYGRETFDDLGKVNKIRNAFAHTFHKVTFTNPKISRQCKEFKVLDKYLIVSTKFKVSPTVPKGPKMTFVGARISLWIALNGHATSRPKRSKELFVNLLY